MVKMQTFIYMHSYFAAGKQPVTAHLLVVTSVGVTRLATWLWGWGFAGGLLERGDVNQATAVNCGRNGHLATQPVHVAAACLAA